MTTMDFESPRLVAEIDGTHARFALEIRRGVLRQGMVLACDGFPDFVSAVRAYLERLTLAQPVIHAAVAIANPVVGDWVQMTNHDWHFSIEQARDQLGLTTLVVVNDFTALASAIPKLGRDQLRQVGGGLVRENSVLAVLGAGTGLGVSGLVPGEQTWTSLGSEGGHCAFSPCDEREDRILAHVRCRFAHVSFERLLSSSGLQLIHEALACDGGAGAAHAPAGERAGPTQEGAETARSDPRRSIGLVALAQPGVRPRRRVPRLRERRGGGVALVGTNDAICNGVTTPRVVGPRGRGR